MFGDTPFFIPELVTRRIARNDGFNMDMFYSFGIAGWNKHNSYGHLSVITGYKWDYTFYKWGYKYL